MNSLRLARRLQDRARRMTPLGRCLWHVVQSDTRHSAPVTWHGNVSKRVHTSVALRKATLEKAWFAERLGPADPPLTFRRYDDGFIVRSMTCEDARIVQRWFGDTGHISRDDIDVALTVYPPGEGFYIGELDGEVVTSVISIPWAEGLFYSSLYYVHPYFRRKGYGARLVEIVLDHLGSHMSCIDSVLGKVVNTYRAVGFRDAVHTARFQGVAGTSYGVTWSDGSLMPATSVNFNKITGYDNKCFIATDSPVRRRFLKKWLALEGGFSVVALGRLGQVVGFGCRGPCLEPGCHAVGPLYADQPIVARALLQALCTGIVGDKYYITILRPNEEAIALTEFFSMEHEYDYLRMHLNGNPQELKKEVFAMTSANVCGF